MEQSSFVVIKYLQRIYIHKTDLSRSERLDDRDNLWLSQLRKSSKHGKFRDNT